jgi:acyl dehydratase
MSLRRKLRVLIFDEMELGATGTVTRTLTRTAREVSARITGDVNALHIESYEKRTRHDAKDTQSVGAEAFGLPVLGTQLPYPGIKRIGQDLRFDGTIAGGDKLTVKILVKGKI